MSTHTIHAALVRSTGPSLGSVVLSALILTIVRMLWSLAYLLRKVPAYIPARAFLLLNGIRVSINWLESATTALSKYGLVYAGLTGDPFMNSARRARALTNSVEGKIGRYGRRKISSEPPLSLLTIAPLTMTLPFTLTTYLFVAHTLNAPEQALGATFLAGGVTALVGLFCVGLVKDTADTLYVCYCIDKETGDRRREEVFILFEYNQPPQPSATSTQRQQAILQPPQTGPEESRPRQPASPLLPLHKMDARTPPTTRSALPAASLYQTQRPVPLSPSAAAIPKSGTKPAPNAPPIRTTTTEEAEVEEDVDPFAQSYRGGEASHLELSAIVGSHGSQERHPQPQQGAERMLSSRELNTKSIFLNPDSKQELSDSESEAGNPESQLLPGSGFL